MHAPFDCSRLVYASEIRAIEKTRDRTSLRISISLQLRLATSSYHSDSLAEDPCPVSHILCPVSPIPSCLFSSARSSRLSSSSES